MTLPDGCGLLAVSFVAAVVLGGCASGSEDELQRATVSGTVTLNGQPLREAVIRFVPTDGTLGPKTSATISEGQFSLNEEHGPVVGRHRIEIESTDNCGLAWDDEEAIQKLKQSGTRRIHVVRVPAIYNSRSTLTRTVTADGSNEFNFELESQPSRRHGG